MMYASKTPRDLNRDPKPMIDPFTGHRVPCADESLGWAWHPGPEYDAAQQNEPNPILVAFRENGDPEFPGPWVAALDAWEAFGGFREWDNERAYFHPLTKATASHIKHARKVLSRLAALAENG